MNPGEFTQLIMNGIVIDNINYYNSVLRSRSSDNVKDPYWKQTLDLFNTLTPTQQSAFIDVMRQVSVDTISSLLGVFDGVSAIQGMNGTILLTYDGETINGELQEHFLAIEERYGQSGSALP